jgi:hypothetical protein
MLLTETPDEGITAEIHRLHKNTDPDVIYRWNGKTWALVEDIPKVEPPPWEHGIGAQLVLDAMDIEEDENILLVSCKVVEMTFESKAGDYQAVRGFWRVAPDNLWAHVPVHDPGKLVDEATGNVDLLARVHHVIASALDAEVYDVASQRANVQATAADTKAATKTRRFDAGGTRKGVVAAEKTGESL